MTDYFNGSNYVEDKRKFVLDLLIYCDDFCITNGLSKTAKDNTYTACYIKVMNLPSQYSKRQLDTLLGDLPLAYILFNIL